MESSDRGPIRDGVASEQDGVASEQDVDPGIAHDVVSASVVILRPVGDLDLLTASVLRRRLANQLCHGRHVILDLAGVTFISSRAVRVLMEAHQMARTRGCALHIATAGRPDLARLFAILDLDTTLLVSHGHADTLAGRHQG